MKRASNYKACLLDLLWTAAAALLLLGSTNARASRQADLAITGITVIDPENRRVLPNHDVLIRGGRIRSVEPSQQEGLPAAGRALDGRGLYLIPGLLDMHVHLNLEGLDVTASTLKMLLANGVTGVRDMSSDCWVTGESRLCLDEMRRLAAQTRSGDIFGPRLLALSSGIIRGPTERYRLPSGAADYMAPESADQAQELRRELRSRGVDLAKVYNTVPREAYFALLRSGRRLEVSGHIPLGVSVEEAARAGQRTIEHARDLPVACSTYGSTYRDVMHRVLEGDMTAEPPTAKMRLESTLASFDPEGCSRTLEILRDSGTYLVPTHGTREMDARAAEPGYRNDPRLQYIAPGLRARWQKDLDDMAEVAQLLAFDYRRFYELGIELTGRAHRAGVRVMAGTDANDTMIFPGFGMVDELLRLAEAGLAPMDVLRTATTVPAEYLGRSRDLGGVAPRKLADLLLLRANPLEDLANVAELEAVVFGGTVYERRDLNEILASVATQVEEETERHEPGSASQP